jgi:hypothetical protein
MVQLCEHDNEQRGSMNVGLLSMKVVPLFVCLNGK